VLPHEKMFPAGYGVASPECSLRRSVALVHSLVDGALRSGSNAPSTVDKLLRSCIQRAPSMGMARRLAIAPAELVGVAQPGQSRIVEAPS
jgi:hypothetical protein